MATGQMCSASWETKKNGWWSIFSSLNCPSAGSRCNGDMTKLPLLLERNTERLWAYCCLSIPRGEVGDRKWERAGTRIISPLPQLVPMMWKSSVWRNQTKRKITEVPVATAVGVDTGMSQQYWLQWSHSIALSLEPGQRNKLIRSPPLVKRVVCNMASSQPGTHQKI